MKKLAVLTLVVLALAFAGTAFASDATSHATPTPDEQAAADSASKQIAGQASQTAKVTATTVATVRSTLSGSTSAAAQAVLAVFDSAPAIQASEVSDETPAATVSDLSASDQSAVSAMQSSTGKQVIIGAVLPKLQNVTNGKKTISFVPNYPQIAIYAFNSGDQFPFYPKGISNGQAPSNKYQIFAVKTDGTVYPTDFPAHNLTPYMIKQYGLSASNCETFLVVSVDESQPLSLGVVSGSAVTDFNFVMPVTTATSASTTPSSGGVGSSGGGCAAGISSASLALALLGFVVARRRG